MKVGTFVLHRFNGDEICSVKGPEMKAFQDGEALSLFLHVDTKVKPIQTLPDTAQLEQHPNAEVYFSLKKLDDLPTLAQLKELEELRVQLSLPGAEPAVEAAEAAQDAAPAEGPSDAAADNDAAADEDELEAAEAEPRAQGLVARGADPQGD